MRKVRNYKTHFNKSQQGVALVELAIVLPLMLMLFIYFFAAVRLFATYNGLGNIARVGALWASSRIPYLDEEGNTVVPECKNTLKAVRTYKFNLKNTAKIDRTNCATLAKSKMDQVAEEYARKLQIKTINYEIRRRMITSANSQILCYVEVTVSTNDYDDSLFGSKSGDLNFGMNATYKPYHPRISFTARSYRSFDCS